jgi:hypothetical protein
VTTPVTAQTLGGWFALPGVNANVLAAVFVAGIAAPFVALLAVWVVMHRRTP